MLVYTYIQNKFKVDYAYIKVASSKHYQVHHIGCGSPRAVIGPAVGSRGSRQCAAGRFSSVNLSDTDVETLYLLQRTNKSLLLKLRWCELQTGTRRLYACRQPRQERRQSRLHGDVGRHKHQQ